MAFDGNPELWKLPERSRKFDWMPFRMGFCAAVIVSIMWNVVSTSWHYVKAPTIAMEVQKTMRLKDESGRSP